MKEKERKGRDGKKGREGGGGGGGLLSSVVPYSVCMHVHLVRAPVHTRDGLG